MTQAYAINDYVRYGSNGVCRITGVEPRASYGGGASADYYVLRPLVNSSATLYVPVDNPALTSRMSRVPSRAEVDALILSTGGAHTCWDDDRKARTELFRETLRRCDQEELLRLVSCIYLKKQELSAAGKKLSATDENVLKQAEKLVESDFSFVLGIPPDAVGAYIRGLLDTGADAAEAKEGE